MDRFDSLLEEAFRVICEAEKLEYAGRADRQMKDDLIRAHSHILSARNRNDSLNRARARKLKT